MPRFAIGIGQTLDHPVARRALARLRLCRGMCQRYSAQTGHHCLDHPSPFLLGWSPDRCRADHAEPKMNRGLTAPSAPCCGGIAASRRKSA
ncbi:hypothetical protein RV134_250213 [Roseovarius sp. EC-HK134]|nr:hypothetical protein RV134_250213 [Roseovarius sp. EC-HK134]VVT07139.1 hypothetical protein RV420_290057 [Roseovarius sp. EC-SD190]